MIIVGIDVGYINMGVVRVSTDDKLNFQFIDAFRYNISIVKHNTVPVQECIIPHTTETCDRVEHFIQENKFIFESADHILIERQPPMGLKDIEALLMNKYRSKVQLISPNKLHKYFNIRHLSYEERKDFVEEIATPHIGHIHEFITQERKHDMADAACMCIYFIMKLKKEQLKKEKLENIKRLPFEDYAFVQPGDI